RPSPKEGLHCFPLQLPLRHWESALQRESTGPSVQCPVASHLKLAPAQSLSVWQAPKPKDGSHTPALRPPHTPLQHCELLLQAWNASTPQPSPQVTVPALQVNPHAPLTQVAPAFTGAVQARHAAPPVPQVPVDCAPG